MKLPEVLRPGEWAKILRVTFKTVQRWDCDGSLPASMRSKGSHHRYSREGVLRFVGKAVQVKAKAAAIYARVSTTKQADAGNLERQRMRLMEWEATEG